MKMMLYNWAVIQDCRLVGYVRAYSEWDAFRMAEKRFGDGFFVERTSIGDYAANNEEQTNETV